MAIPSRAFFVLSILALSACKISVEGADPEQDSNVEPIFLSDTLTTSIPTDTALDFSGETLVTATVIDSEKRELVTDDITVRFSSDCVDRGLSTITSTATTHNGIAVVTYSAGSCENNDKITASLENSHIASVTISISDPIPDPDSEPTPDTDAEPDPDRQPVSQFSNSLLLDSFEYGSIPVVRPYLDADDDTRYLWRNNDTDSGGATRPGELSISSDQAIFGDKSLKISRFAGGESDDSFQLLYYNNRTETASNNWHYLRELNDKWSEGKINRMRFWIKVPVEMRYAEGSANHAQTNFHIGTYTRDSETSRLKNESGNGHWYHYYNIGYEGDMWRQVIVDAHPNHQRSGSGSTEYPVIGELHPDTDPGKNYFDLMTYFYLHHKWSDTTWPADWYVDGFEFYEDPNNEDIEQIYSLSGVYNNQTSEVVVGWKRNKSTSSKTFDVRYAFSSFHENGGFTHGTTAPEGSDIAPYSNFEPNGYNGMEYRSSSIPLEDNNAIYIAIKHEDSPSRFREIRIPLTQSAYPTIGENTVTAPKNIPAFPGAEGFGANTPGGRGGEIVKVTNLNDSGPGSLRAAVTAPPRHYFSNPEQYQYESEEAYIQRLDASGGRIVVFDVSGIINLESTLIISYPFMTIAGETSPGGILVTGHQTTLNAHDIIMRFMRFRVGSHRIADGADPEKLDSMSILGSHWATNDAYNIIVDHSSFSWGVDETLTLTGGVLNTTVQWSIVSEGLSHAGHPKGEHSKGLMVSGKYVNPSSISLLRNYIAHNTSRNPLMASPMDVDTRVDGRNNISYDWNGGSSPSIEGSAKVNWVHNYAKAGLRSHAYSYEIRVGDETSGEPQLFVLGNIGSSRDSQEDDQWNVGVSWRDELAEEENLRTMTPWDIPVTTTYEMSADVAECILSAVGATAPIRDSVDARVVNDFINGTGEIIDDVRFPQDFPVFENKPIPTDSDNDGMSDSWESSHGMTIGENDSADDNDSDGYTNIEEYLHELAANSYIYNENCMSSDMQ